MKRTKYLTGALLFLIAFALIGELSVWRLSSFYTSFPSTTLYLQEGQNRSELVHDVKVVAKENGIEAFTVNVDMHSSFSVSLDIYGTPGVKEYLHTQAGVSDGTFRSLFLGEVMISVQELDDLPEDFVPDRFLLTGDHDSNVLFKKALINKYAGNFPRQINATDENVLLIIGIWAIVFMLLLLLSNYEIALAKREVIVRMVSGEPLTAFVWTNILKDTLMLSVAFCAAFLTGVLLSSATYHIAISLVSFGVFLCINAVLHARLLKTDFRKDVGSSASAKTVLKTSYIYKCVAVVASVAIMTGNIALITEAVACYKQRDFFEQHKDYYYINFPSDPNQEHQGTVTPAEFMAGYKSISLVDLQSWDMGVEYVYADANTVGVLTDSIPELRTVELAPKVYFLMPVKLADNPLIREDALDIWTAYYQGDFEYEFIPCRKTTTIAVGSTGKIASSIKDAPIIILNNLGTSSYASFSNLGYISQCTMFQVDTDELERLSEDGVINYATNANDNFSLALAAARRNMFAGFLFLFMVLSINAVISKNMVYYDCKINAVEYSLKKLLGYTPIRIYSITLLPTVGVSLAATAICSAAMLVKGETAVFANVFGCVVIGLLDLCFVSYYLHKTSHIGMVQVIKGGSI